MNDKEIESKHMKRELIYLMRRMLELGATALIVGLILGNLLGVSINSIDFLLYSIIIHIYIIMAAFEWAEKISRFLMDYVGERWTAITCMKRKKSLIYDNLPMFEDDNDARRQRKRGYIHKVGLLKLKFKCDDGTEEEIRINELYYLLDENIELI